MGVIAQPSGHEDEIVVENIGNYNSEPVVRFYGPTTDPRITNLDTGEFEELSAVFEYGERVSMDTVKRTVVQDPDINLYGSRSDDSRWLKVESGMNHFGFSDGSFNLRGPYVNDQGRITAMLPADGGYGAGYAGVINGHGASIRYLNVEGGPLGTTPFYCVQESVSFNEAQGTIFKAVTWAEATARNVYSLGKGGYIAANSAKLGTVLTDANAEASAVQLAIWNVVNGTDITVVTNTSIKTRAQALVTAAGTSTVPEYPVGFRIEVTTQLSKTTNLVACIATLLNDNDMPLANKALTLGIEGTDLKTLFTNAAGQATFYVAASGKARDATIKLKTWLYAGSVMAPPSGQMVFAASPALVTRRLDFVITPSPIFTGYERYGPQRSDREVFSANLTNAAGSFGNGYSGVINGHSANFRMLTMEGSPDNVSNNLKVWCIQEGVQFNEDPDAFYYAYSRTKAVADTASFTGTAKLLTTAALSKAGYIVTNSNTIGTPLADVNAEAVAIQLALWNVVNGLSYTTVNNTSMKTRADALVATTGTLTEAYQGYRMDVYTQLDQTTKNISVSATVFRTIDAGDTWSVVPSTGVTLGIKDATGNVVQTLNATTTTTGVATWSVPATDVYLDAVVYTTQVMPAGVVMRPPEGQMFMTGAPVNITRSVPIVLSAKNPSRTGMQIVYRDAWV